MEKKLAEYKKLLLIDKKTMIAFMQKPESELKMHTGYVLTKKQQEEVKLFLSAGKHGADAFPPKCPEWVVSCLWGMVWGLVFAV